MEMNRLTREADELIRKVVSRYNTLYSPQGTISQVDLDLMLDDLRVLYEKFRIIGQLNLQHIHQDAKKIVPHPAASQEPEMKKEAEPEKPVEAVPDQCVEAVREVPEEEPHHQIAEEPKAEEVVPAETHEAETREEEIADSRPQPEEASRTTEDKQPPVQQQNYHDDSVRTIADKYKTSQKSLGDVISTGTGSEESIASRLSHQAISDLKSFIGLAEKFAFINELFGGDSLAYEKAIVQLNGATRLSEAEAYINTLRLNNRWPENSPQALLLLDIIRRKFGQA